MYSKTSKNNHYMLTPFSQKKNPVQRRENLREYWKMSKLRKYRPHKLQPDPSCSYSHPENINPNERGKKKKKKKETS